MKDIDVLVISYAHSLGYLGGKYSTVIFKISVSKMMDTILVNKNENGTPYFPILFNISNKERYIIETEILNKCK